MWLIFDFNIFLIQLCKPILKNSAQIILSNDHKIFNEESYTKDTPVDSCDKSEITCDGIKYLLNCHSINIADMIIDNVDANVASNYSNRTIAGPNIIIYF